MRGPDTQDRSNSGEALSLLSPEAVEFRMDIAGIGARSHAFVIDWHIRLLLALGWLVIVGVMMFSWNSIADAWRETRSGETLAVWLWLAPAAAIYFLYHPVLEIAMSGRTPGKRMAGVRLVTRQGHTPGAGAVLIRNLFRLLDSLPAFYMIGLGTVALTKQQVRIGDLAAGLVLVYDETVNERSMRLATDMAMSARLQPSDQALLLELLQRWKQMDIETRIDLGLQFIKRVGETKPNLTGAKKRLSDEIVLSRLQQLAGLPGKWKI